MAIRLTAAQVAFLRGESLNGRRNKVALALALAQVTGRDLAAALKMSPVDISEIRTGKYGPRFSLSTAQKLARVFGLTTDDLFPPAEATPPRSEKPKRQRRAAA